MVFVSRKIAYPFFTAMVLLVFFALLYIGFFSQSLVVDTHNSSVSIVGAQILLKIPVQNVSNHVIDNIIVTISSDKSSQATPLKGEISFSRLLPGERYEYLTAIPIGESSLYTAVISAPFNRPISLSIPIDPTTVDPVDASVLLPASMVVGEEYNYSVKLCNVSQSDLGEVFWTEDAAAGDFRESFYPHTVSLAKNECKTIYSTLTPIRSGKITLGFSLKVGALSKTESKDLNILPSGNLPPEGGEAVGGQTAGDNNAPLDADSNIGNSPQNADGNAGQGTNAPPI